MIVKSVVMFSNGNYCVFDENGQQIVELQTHPQRIAKILIENPDIECSIGVWEEGLIKTHPSCLAWLLARMKKDVSGWFKDLYIQKVQKVQKETNRRREDMKKFIARSIWSGNTIRLEFDNPSKAEQFQNEMCGDGCIVEDIYSRRQKELQKFLVKFIMNE